jgi:ammonia channel protein AmtB
MLRFKALLIAAPVAVGLLAAPAAHAEWRGHGGGDWHGRGGWHDGYGHDRGRGVGVAGAILGLGAAAVLGGVIGSQAYAPPPVYYAPPPVYYAQPQAYYAPPPVYYSAPPGYYAPRY